MTTDTRAGPAYVFLSYASADRQRALHIADLLEGNRIPVWIDRKSIAGGTSWSAEIVRGIEECAVLLVLCSPAAMESPNVQQEIQLAWEHRRALLPVVLEQTRLPRAVEYALAGRQWIEVLDRPDNIWLPAVLDALNRLGLQPPRSAANTTVTLVEPPAGPPRRHNLPAALTEFVGRRAELAEVTRLLGTTRLLTLAGTGGCGKTRLALEVAAGLLDAYPDGIWLVELAALTDPELVPRAVAGALGIREDTHRPLTDLLTELLGPRRLLVLLDNCEHLVESCARLAQTLLRGGPHLRILATSREALGIPGEVAWRVPSLALPPADALPALSELAQTDAVHFFVERARGVMPAFALTAQNAAGVVQICRRLDGIPLALELAAARVKVLPVEQVAARLDQRFRLLTGGSRAALPRQQTLAALVSRSYDLLGEPERILFERLAVFAGGFTLEAVQRVCVGEGVDEWEALDLLQRLVEKSLVVVEEGPSGAERYRLLETLRQFGREKLVARGEADAIHRRHAAYFLGLAELPGGSPGDLGLSAWLQRLGRDHDNLRQALSWTIGEGESVGADPLAGLRLVGALGIFWLMRGPYAEARAWAAAALAHTPDAPLILRARALLTAAINAYQPGDYAAAEPLAKDSIRLAREAGDQHVAAWATHILGNITFLGRGDLDRGEALLNEALQICERLGDTASLADGLTTLGRLALYRKDFKATELHLEQARIIYRRSDPAGPSRARWCIFAGSVAFHQGEYGRAEALYAETLALARRDSIGLLVGWARSNLGMVAHARGDLDGAVARYREALGEYRAIGSLDGISEVFQRLAKVAVARLEFDRAVRLMGAADALPFTPGSFEPPFEHEAYNRCVAEVRAALGEAAFAAAFAAGRALPLEEAIAAALAETHGGQTVESSRLEGPPA